MKKLKFLIIGGLVFITFVIPLACQKAATKLVEKELIKMGEKKGVGGIKRVTRAEAAKIAEKNAIKEAEKKEGYGFYAKTRLARTRLFINPKDQYITAEQYEKWLSEPGNASKLILGRPKDGGVLRENMRAPMGSNYATVAKTTSQAHHIVAADDNPSTRISRGIFDKFGIDINDPMNGIFMPDGDMSSLLGCQHSGRHKTEYHDEVAQRLQAARSKLDVYEILDGIKRDIFKCREISLYNNQRMNTVVSSFKK